jgi:hypothetical protein
VDKDDRPSSHGQTRVRLDDRVHDLIFALELNRSQQGMPQFGHTWNEHVCTNYAFVFRLPPEDETKSIENVFARRSGKQPVFIPFGDFGATSSNTRDQTGQIAHYFAHGLQITNQKGLL